MRDPNALFNTHITTLTGTTSDASKIRKEPMDVRFTSDGKGETLSISNGRMQFTVDFKKIMKLVEETREDRKDGH